MDINKKFLAYYLTYFSIIEEYAVYNLPMCMDSFIKNEITTESLDEMFSAIEKYLFNNSNQVFFSLVNENLKYLKYQDQYNVIDIGGKVLRKDYYRKVVEKIEQNQK